MPRTTIDIDATVLRELHERRRRSGKSLGALVSELLADQLASSPAKPTRTFDWNSQRMNAKVDLEDKDAVYAALEHE
jgi:hypothetical protein